MDTLEKKELHAEVKRDVLKEIEREGRYFGRGAFTFFGTYLGAAFGFVIGLAWNNAIQSFINYYVPNQSHSIAVQFYYAIALTLAVALGTYVSSRISHRGDVPQKNS